MELEVKEFDGDHYICTGNGGDEWFVGENRMHPYTLKPEFEYGEMVEVSDSLDGKWHKAIFKTYLPDPDVKFRFFVDVNEKGYTSWWAHCRKPKKELIEINGKKYDAEKVKERLADLKAEE